MRFEPGSIFATEGKGFAGWCVRHLLSPPTDRFHFGLIWEYIEDLNDYTIVESVNIGLFAKGISVGYLSKYKGRDVEVYSITDPAMADWGVYACYNILHFQETGYDLMLIPRLTVSGILCALRQLVMERRLRPIKPDELSYSRDDKYICTEAANEGWWALDYPLVPPGVAPTPASFKRAELDGKLKRDYKGDLHDILA